MCVGCLFRIIGRMCQLSMSLDSNDQRKIAQITQQLASLAEEVSRGFKGTSSEGLNKINQLKKLEREFYRILDDLEFYCDIVERMPIYRQSNIITLDYVSQFIERYERQRVEVSTTATSAPAA